MIADTRNRVLRTLGKYGSLKVSEIVGYTDVTWRHLDRVLPALEKEGLVRSHREANKKIYEITSNGKDALRIQYEAILSEYRAILAPSKAEERRRRLPAALSQVMRELEDTEYHRNALGFWEMGKAPKAGSESSLTPAHLFARYEPVPALIESLLDRLKLSREEMETYAILRQKGPMKFSDVHRNPWIPEKRMREAIELLEKRGLITVLPEKPDVYSAVPLLSIVEKELGLVKKKERKIPAAAEPVTLTSKIEERQRRKVSPSVSIVKPTMTSRPLAIPDTDPLQYLPAGIAEVSLGEQPTNRQSGTVDREELFLLSKMSLAESGLSLDDLSKGALTRQEIAKMVQYLEEHGFIESASSVKGQKKAGKYKATKEGAQLALEALRNAPEESWLWLTEGEFTNTPLGRIYKRRSEGKETLHTPQESADQ
jgi:sugar-specific transcriptional regulator TrmB